ncbi:MAG: hypothetical protein GXP55_04210 [Deltaproteobacteria bacterium]|nr:hypothetical protein [Deltaproteobacteria bacterium]
MLCVAGISLLSSCPGSGGSDSSMPMEIGTRASDGSFVPLADGDTMPVLLGANGLNMIVTSLRATGINPAAPDPSVEVQVAGIVMAADIEGARVDMEDDGTGFVLWELRVPFQTQLCCYVCGDATIVARIRDNSGQRFEGRVAVRLERGGCPDLTACCDTADMCPDPTLAQVCP